MLRIEHLQGAKRSLLISAAILLGSTLLALGLRQLEAGALGYALWKLLIFPHGGLVTRAPFPARPAGLLDFPAACGLALIQWALVMSALAWLSKAMSWRKQLLLSGAAILGVGVLFAFGAMLLGCEFDLG